MIIPRSVATLGAYSVLAAILFARVFAGNAADPVRLAGPTGDDDTSDRALRRNLEAAEDAIHDEDWTKTATLLDRVLTLERDAVITMLREDDGKERPGIALPHQEAERLLQKGRDAYQHQFGDLAKGLLNEARKKNDAEQLRRIVRVYRYTAAGQEALLVLAELHFHKNEVAQAAAAYEALLRQRVPALWTAEQLYQAALTFRASGDSANRDLVGRELLARAGKAPVEIEGRKWSREELQKAFDKPEPASIIADGLTQRAYPESNGRRIDVEPILKPVWRRPLVRKKEAENWIDTAEAALAKQGRPLLSGALPVGIEVVTQSQAGSLVVFRSHWGLHAVDPYAGKLEWESPSLWSLDRMATDPKMNALFDKSTKSVLEKRPRSLFENSTIGVLSTDGIHAYAVEDFELPPGTVTETSAEGLRPDPMKWDYGINDAINASKLLAFDLATGKLKWEIGGVTSKDEKPELPDCWFLGAPLPLDGKLYLAVEAPVAHGTNEVRLAIVETRTGKVLSVKPLFSHSVPFSGPRRLHAVQLVHGNGVLVCCANSGIAVGVDLLTQRLRWIVRYRDDLEKGALVDKDAEWMPTPLVVSGDKVILTAADSTAIHCLNLRDGERLWSKPRTADDLYLAGVVDGKVLVVGNGYINACWIDTGKKFWQRYVGTPSGFGVASGHFYFLPLKTTAASGRPGIDVLDLKERATTILTSETKEIPGNLLIFNGYVLSQTPRTLTAYPQAITYMKSIDEKLNKTPGDSEALRQRGLLHRFRGEWRPAAEDLRAAMKNTLNMQKRTKIRDQLLEMLKELYFHDAGQLDQHWNKYKEVIGQEFDPTKAHVSGLGGAEWQREIHFLMTVAMALEKDKQYAASARYYAVLIDETEDANFIALPQTPETEILVRVWAQTRLDEMRKAASPEQRKLIEAEIKKREK